VGQRVHPGRGRDRCGKGERQFRIGKDRFREYRRRENDPLDMGVVFRDHRRAPDFASGSRGRRQRDEMRQRLFDRPHLRMVPGVLEHVARMHRHQRDDLRYVESGSAAETDHRIGTVRAIGIDTGAHLRCDRVSLDAGIHADLKSGKRAAEIGEHRQRREALVGNDQRALAADAREVLSNELSCARPEVDRRRKRELLDVHRSGA
jgi:hypothetical protein